MKSWNNLFEYMKITDKNKEKLLDCLKLLPEKYRLILKEKCGPNYDGIGSKQISINDAQTLRTRILPSLKASYILLHNKEIGSAEYQKALEAIKESLPKTRNRTSINNKKSKNVTAIIDNNFIPKETLPNLQDKNENESILSLITKETNLPVLEGVIVKDNKGFTKQDYEDILSLFKSEEFEKLMRLNFPIEDIVIATLIHKGFQDKRYPLTNVLNFLGVSKEELVKSTKRTTEAYRTLINQKIDEYILSLEKKSK